MRYLFILTLVLIMLLTATFYFVAFTPYLVEKQVPVYKEKFFKDVTLNDFKVGGQTFAYPDILKLFHIHAEFEYQHETYQLDIGQMDIINFPAFISSQRQLVLKVEDFNILRKGYELVHSQIDATVNMKPDGFSDGEFIFHDGEIKFGAYDLTQLQARLGLSREALKIADIKARTYGGQTKGKIEINLLPTSKQTVDLEFSNVNSRELGKVNKRIFSQIDGEFNGTMRMTRVEDVIQVLTIFAEIPKGGTVNPGLGQRLAGYMTSESNRGKVDELIGKNVPLVFNYAEFRILNVNPYVAGITFLIDGKEDKFLIHETINVDMDRMFKSLAWKF